MKSHDTNITLKELLDTLECYAPLRLSREYCKAFGAYDNSGIIVNSGQDVNGIMFALDLNTEVIKAAVEKGYNTIVTHHPAIYGAILHVDATPGADTQGIYECVRHGISVISMHLNLDIAPKGIDESLMEACGGRTVLAEQEQVEGGAYGRVYPHEMKSFKEYFEEVKAALGAEHILAFGDWDRKVHRTASFCGAGCSDEAIDFAWGNGADVFVSSDLKHHQITSILNKGMCIIVPTHYAAELYGFRKFAEVIGYNVPVPSDIYCDGRIV
ncbi:MAG: Nif3-like dinuclear metal center hexameric protein [Clostridia bacterium]|nr:Nif3-like dinuclear metal center hexameric protein [Clostridia bacterium]